jgi:hypothetical protein
MAQVNTTDVIPPLPFRPTQEVEADKFNQAAPVTAQRNALLKATSQIFMTAQRHGRDGRLYISRSQLAGWASTVREHSSPTTGKHQNHPNALPSRDSDDKVGFSI